jgi:hypothetical protein
LSDNPWDQVLARPAAIEAGQARLMEQVNDQIERVLNHQSNLGHEFQHARDFLVGDALVAGRRWLDMDAAEAICRRVLQATPHDAEVREKPAPWREGGST